MRRTVLLVAFLLTAGIAAADTGQVVPAPAWQYQFPPGEFENVVVTPDLRYLAIGTSRWSYHPVGKPEDVTTEGENAIYLFDLAEKRLVWRQVLPENSRVIISGITARGGFVAVEVSEGGQVRTQRASRGGQTIETIYRQGPREPGLRLYDRSGRLVASKAPLVRFGWQWGSPLLRRGLAEGEEPLPAAIEKALAAEGVAAVSGSPPSAPFAFSYRPEGQCLTASNPDGSGNWEWQVPRNETRITRSQALVYSPDGQYALAMFVPGTGFEAGNTRAVGTRRLYLFGRKDGLLWSADLPLRISDRVGARDMGIALSNGARSILITRYNSGRAVDILDARGATRSQLEFSGIRPRGERLSPNGRYWAAVLARWSEGPGVDDMGWTEGLHVFDCDTGKVVWSSPWVARAPVLFTTDKGGVIAFSTVGRVLAVFGPPAPEGQGRPGGP